MNEDGKAMNQKMELDSLIKNNIASADSTKALSGDLGKLSDNMMDWMHQFDPEQKGKSKDQLIAYLTEEKAQLMQLDSSYKKLLKSSEDYLKSHHIKTSSNMPGMKM